MKSAVLRKFANEDVVGQKFDGLFFEGRVERKNTGAFTVRTEEGALHPGKIKWLVMASKYC